jgi:hypothetical protein
MTFFAGAIAFTVAAGRWPLAFFAGPTFFPATTFLAGAAFFAAAFFFMGDFFFLIAMS